jgi:hypothetical protein
MDPYRVKDNVLFILYAVALTSLIFSSSTIVGNQKNLVELKQSDESLIIQYENVLSDKESYNQNKVADLKEKIDYMSSLFDTLFSRQAENFTC